LLDTPKHDHYGARDFEGHPRLEPAGEADVAMARDKRSLQTSDLASRISKAKGARNAGRFADKVRRNEMSGVGRAYRLASEFIAAIAVGALLGWGVDFLFGTTPFGMIALLIFGFAAGVVNVVRAAKALNAAAPIPDQTGPAIDDDNDD
jgi:ATP synthase protein I